MIDGSEKRKLQLAFEIQSSRVFQKRSNLTQIMLVSLSVVPQDRRLALF